MSAKKNLKKLLQRAPHGDELSGTMRELAKESDRSVAIVATSIIETVLQRGILAVLKEQDRKITDRLFGLEGPARDFSSKIMLARAIGLIDDNVEAELHLMRHIRNAFAHAIVPVSFETPEIEALMEEFTSMALAKEIMKVPLSGILRLTGTKVDYRESFVIIAQWLSVVIDHDVKEMGGTPILTGHPKSM